MAHRKAAQEVLPAAANFHKLNGQGGLQRRPPIGRLGGRFLFACPAIPYGRLRPVFLPNLANTAMLVFPVENAANYERPSRRK